MKAILEFDISDPDDRAEYKMCNDANRAHSALFEIMNEVFRPARKHGYNDVKINALISGGETEEAIGALESLAYGIISDHKLDIS